MTQVSSSVTPAFNTSKRSFPLSGTITTTTNASNLRLSSHMSTQGTKLTKDMYVIYQTEGPHWENVVQSLDCTVFT